MAYKDIEKQNEYHTKYRLNHKEEKKEYNTQYYQDHKEECKKYSKQYYLNHTKEGKKYAKQYRLDHPKECKQWRERNKERLSVNYEKWLENNPEYMKEWNKTEKGKAHNQRGQFKRRTRENNIVNTLTAKEWLNILKKYKFRCAYCGKEFTLFNRETRDHVIPISKGGNNVKENIVPACKSCNSKKSNKILNQGDNNL